MAGRKSRDWHDRATFAASVVAAVGAVAAASFTGWQAWTAKDTENRQLRAYLFIDHGPLSEVAPGKFNADLAIRAAGVTPAYKVKLAATFEIGPYLLNETTLSDRVGGNTQDFDYAVIYGADKARNQPISMQFLPEATKLLEGDSQRLYLHGNIRYSDIFSDEHQYDFCFVFHPSRDPHGSERGCEKYNQPR
jgi:hypothetical protein